ADALSTIARRLERASDQAKNICEEVLYMCTGAFAKHKGAQKFRILFVDGHNQCLCQIAEGIGREMNQQGFDFISAGITPRPVDRATVEFMKGKGIDISGQSSKSVEQLPELEKSQVVITFTPEARKGLR